MRRNIWLAVLVATLRYSARWTAVWRSCAGQSQDQSAQPTATQQDPLADAARRAKEQKKDRAKTPKVFTNDNLPSSGQPGPSVSTSPASNGDKQLDSGSEQGTATSDEKMWRDKFAKLNHKLEQDQSELDVLQRELSVLNTQYYGGDPMKGLQQGLSQTGH